MDAISIACGAVRIHLIAAVLGRLCLSVGTERRAARLPVTFSVSLGAFLRLILPLGSYS